jgi:hypothetical protein
MTRSGRAGGDSLRVWLAVIVCFAVESGAQNFDAPPAIHIDPVDDEAPDLVTHRAGTWIALWEAPGEVLASRSTNGGLTWDPATTLYATGEDLRS